ncbi:MAG: hypothetical protein WKF77_09305 [Planctomycetaceae bacterium]
MIKPQGRKTDMESTSLLRSSGVLCANDLRLHRRLPHAAAPQRIASRPPFNEYTHLGAEAPTIQGT